jgi:putative copper resistance protein D
VSAVGAPRIQLRRGAAAPLLVGLLATAGATVALSLVVSGATPGAGSALREAGPVTGWLVHLTRAMLDLATFGTLGSLAVAGWLLPRAGRSPDDLLPSRSRALLAVAGRWSLAWTASALLLLIASVSQLVGQSIGRTLSTPALYRLAWEIPANRALLVIALAGLAVAAAGSRLRRHESTRLVLVGATMALVPLLTTGHAGTASNHFLATQSLVVHVVAASLWVGGLMVLVLHLRGDAAALVTALPRFSRLALWCFAAVAVSGVLGGWLRLGTSWDTWTSTYGALVMAKATALVVLGLIGASHRRWSLPRVAAGHRHAFARLAVVEVLVMTVATGLAVVLSRTAPPVDALTRAVPPHANTFPTVDRGIDPVSAWSLLTEARPDAWLLTAAVAALVGYLAGVRAVARRGQVWPARRTASFVAATFVATWAMCGGLGAYSGALLSAEVARLLTMGLVVPALLTWGSPVALSRTASGVRGTPGRADGWISPVNGLVVLVGTLAATLMTPLLQASLRSPVLHTALPLGLTAAGLLFLGPLLGGRAGSAPGRDAGDDGLLLAVLAVLLIVYGAHIWTSTALLAGDWFGALDWYWGDAETDQRYAGLVAAGFGLALMAVARFSRRPVGDRGDTAEESVPAQGRSTS